MISAPLRVLVMDGEAAEGSLRSGGFELLVVAAHEDPLKVMSEARAADRPCQVAVLAAASPRDAEAIALAHRLHQADERIYLILTMPSVPRNVADFGLGDHLFAVQRREPSDLSELVRALGLKWCMEREFEAARKSLELTNRAYGAVNSEFQRQNRRLVEQERELSAQASRLEATLDNMDQGLLMFDSEGIVQVYNRRVGELLDLPDELLSARPCFDDLRRHQAQNGEFAGLTATKDPWFADEGAAAKHLSYDRVRPNGTALEVRTVQLQDGGAVRTYTDVTTRRRQELELHAREEELRAQNMRFEAALANMQQGLLMLDAELRITVFNRRFADLIGFSPAVLRIGGTGYDLVAEAVELGHHAGKDAQEAYAAWLDRLAQRVPSSHEQTLADGRVLCVTYAPMADGGWVLGYDDITHRKRAEEAIWEQNLRFDAALENMSQGLCMFDGDMRLIVCNTRYAEMFGLTRADVPPGTTLQQILAMRIAVGNFSGDPDEFVRERLRGARGGVSMRADLEMHDGRTLALVHEPLPSGGWIATFEDITYRKQMEREVVEQNGRFDAALSNMAQGLAMFDAQMRLIVCNRRYCEMIGLSPDFAKPGTTLRQLIEHGVERGLHPGRTAEDLLDERLTLLAAREPGALQTRIAGKRTIETTYQPMAGGGWVATYDDITERQQAEARIAHMARHDALTDLPNRVLFREKMDEALARVHRGESIAILCLDLDRFKAVNDTLGHPIGDALLKAVTERLQREVRETDMVARLGGDEFAVLQIGIGRPEEASALARRLIEAISVPYEIEGNQVVVGSSIGVSISPGDGLNGDALLKNADMALYKAKAEGRGTYRFFEPAMDARLQERRRLELELRRALALEQFELYFQPLVDAKTCEINCMEALLRWRHPELGQISPVDFIPLAEDIGLIVPLGDWVIRKACAEAVKWPAGIKVAVNLSPAQFGGSTLVSGVVAALAQTGLPPHRLELEITESVLLQDNENTLATLHQLRTLGVRVAMDDFGTGYSSLSYLRSFPFDKIKIDRSFIRELAERSDCVAIVKAVAGLGTSLGMTTTAEGVETEEQLAQVREQGCTEVQGFYFSPPVPARDLPALFKSRRAA